MIMNMKLNRGHKIIILVCSLLLMFFICFKIANTTTTISEGNIEQEKEKINQITERWFSEYKTRLENSVFSEDYQESLKIKQIREIHPIYNDEQSNRVGKWLIIFEDKKGNCMLEVLLNEGQKEPSMWTPDCRLGTPNSYNLKILSDEFKHIDSISFKRVVKTDNIAKGHYYSIYEVHETGGLMYPMKVYMEEEISQCLLVEDHQ